MLGLQISLLAGYCALSFLIPINMVFANHSNFVVNQQTGRYVQGDRIWTNVTIFAGIPTSDQTNSDNKTRFTVVYTDTLLDYQGVVRTHNETIWVGPEDNETAAWDRRFIEGTWNLKVEVFEEGSTGNPFEPWIE